VVRRDHRLDSPPEVVSADLVERSLLLVRGHKVILDVDLARLYGVETKALNRAVTRNSTASRMTSPSG
jgi:ORF6N domain